MDYISQNLWLFWTVIMFICLILELSSGDFYVTCFAIGALILLGAGGGMGGMLRDEYPADPSASGEGYPKGRR